MRPAAEHRLDVMPPAHGHVGPHARRSAGRRRAAPPGGTSTAAPESARPTVHLYRGGAPVTATVGRAGRTAARSRSAWSPGRRQPSGCRPGGWPAAGRAGRARRSAARRGARSPGRPRSWTVVSGPARTTVDHAPANRTRVPGREQGGRVGGARRRASGRCGRPAASRPARRSGRCRRTGRPAPTEPAGTRAGACPAGAPPLGGQPGQVREPGREAAERHPQLGRRRAAATAGRRRCPSARRRRQVRPVVARPGSRPARPARRRVGRRRRRPAPARASAVPPGRRRRRAARSGRPGTISTATSSPASRRRHSSARQPRPRHRRRHSMQQRATCRPRRCVSPACRTSVSVHSA